MLFIEILCGHVAMFGPCGSGVASHVSTNRRTSVLHDHRHHVTFGRAAASKQDIERQQGDSSVEEEVGDRSKMKQEEQAKDVTAVVGTTEAGEENGLKRLEFVKDYACWGSKRATDMYQSTKNVAPDMIKVNPDRRTKTDGKRKKALERWTDQYPFCNRMEKHTAWT